MVTNLIERPTTLEVESRVPEAPPVERKMEPSPVTPPPRVFRWLGWVLGLALIVGVGGAIWWLQTREPVATNIEAIDPHESPEIMHLLPVTPQAETIDPHESPEIMHLERNGS